MSLATCECVEAKVQDETFAFDAQFESGEAGPNALDSGAGVHAWPKDKLKEVPTLPRKPGLRMRAASGWAIASRQEGRQVPRE